MDFQTEPPNIEEHEQDEVLYSMDVYFSQQLSQNLYLCQYPAQRVLSSTVDPLAVRVKDRSRMMEVDLPTNTELHYHREKGRLYANGGRPPREDEEPKYLDRQTISSQVLPPSTNYMIGVVRNNELHLTPVRGTYQLRPSLKYLDKIDDAKKVADKQQREEKTKLENQGRESKKDSRFVGLSAKSSDANQQVPRNAYLAQMRLAEEESWTELAFNNYRSEEANEEYGEMFAVNREDLVCATMPQEYLDMISADVNGTIPA